jgi:peroxiredoxin
MKRWMYAVLLLAFFAAAGCSKEVEKPAVEGNYAPDFTLKDLNGQEVQLSSLKGKVVLVNFWATWCPPCREEIPSMMKLNQAMQGKPFQMLAISIDEGGKEDVERYFKKQGVSLPALLDSDGKVAKRYGTTGVPETFVLNTKGLIVKKVIGPMDWASPQVVAALDEMTAGK